MRSMENAMKRLADAPEDHATPPKRRRQPPAPSAMSDSGDSDPEQSDSQELNFPPNGDPPKPGSSVTEDALLNEIAQDFESDEQTDPKVAQKLADIVNKRWGSKLEEAKLKEKLAKYNRPDNCEKLTVPKVNPEIRNKLKHGTKSADLRLANMQKVLVKVGSAVAKATDTLLAIRADPEKTSALALTEKLGKLVTYNADALALLGHVNIELSYRRRDAIKPNLNDEYSSLCGSQVPITGLLFGDELHSQLNNIKATNKIGHTTTAKPSYRNHSDGWKGKSSHSSGKPFLGKRGRSYRPHNNFYKPRETAKKSSQ